MGKKKFSDCPFLKQETITRLSATLMSRDNSEQEQAEFIDKLEEKTSHLDLKKRAQDIGATYINEGLTIHSMGKDFHIDHRGKVVSRCHIIPWVVAPILSYITNEKHTKITGRWISFRELQGGMEWQNLFTKRCEEVLRKLADDNPSLLHDIMDLFMGEAIDIFEADIGLVLHPLPHIPLLICYQRADEDLGSKLTILFDECCDTNLHIKSIYTLCAGIVRMFGKIAEHHL